MTRIASSDWRGPIKLDTHSSIERYLCACSDWLFTQSAEPGDPSNVPIHAITWGFKSEHCASDVEDRLRRKNIGIGHHDARVARSCVFCNELTTSRVSGNPFAVHQYVVVCNKCDARSPKARSYVAPLGQ